jgi:hypothetical protein
MCHRRRMNVHCMLPSAVPWEGGCSRPVTSHYLDERDQLKHATSSRVIKSAVAWAGIVETPGNEKVALDPLHSKRTLLECALYERLLECALYERLYISSCGNQFTKNQDRCRCFVQL